MPQNSYTSISKGREERVPAITSPELDRSVERDLAGLSRSIAASEPQTKPAATAKASIAGIFAAAVATLALLGAVNYAVDPYQQYRDATFYPARYWRPFQRYITPGLAKRPDYAVAIVGSSMLETLSNKEASLLLGGTARNLCLSGSTAFETGLVLDLALQHAPIRRAMIDLNVNSFAGAINHRAVRDPLPQYLWDDSRLNDPRYLLPFDTALRSLDILIGRRGGPEYSTDTDSPWAWTNRSAFSGKHVVDGLDPTDINHKFRQGPRTIDEMMANFDANLLTRIQAHPKVQFDLVHPPYSILAWTDFQQRKQVDVTLEFKRRVYQRVKSLPNVTVHDFQSAAVIDDLNQYTDIYHYGRGVGSWMLKGMRDGSFRVTDTNLESLLAAQREKASQADPRKIIAAYR